MNYSSSSKRVWIFFSALWRWNIKLIGTLRVDRHQAPCLSGVSSYTVIICLSTRLVLHILSPVVKCCTSSKMVWFFTGHYAFKCYRPLWIFPARKKWVDFSDVTVEVNHQIHWHSEVRSASCPMFIGGFPLYGYLMTVSTPCFAYFIARV